MIGGEFPISVPDLLRSPQSTRCGEEVYKYASGRAALYQILKYLKEQRGVQTVLLPDYLCDTILVPIRKLGLEYRYYALNNSLELQPDDYVKAYCDKSATLLINYFGLQDLSGQVGYIRSIDANAIIIEDDVQAYYEFKKPLGDVDFKYTSLRKTFAFPDGGLVKSRYVLPVAESHNTFGQYKAAAALMKSMRDGNFDDSVYLDISKIGGSKIDNELHLGMTPISKRLYATVDEENIKRRRQENARYLADRLRELGISTLLPITSDSVPLFVPIVLAKRDEVRQRMFSRQIFCPVHWPTNEKAAKKGMELAKTELSLIIDQRYGQREMDEILSCL